MEQLPRLLYLSTVEENDVFQGVHKKMIMQCKAFEENGYTVTKINAGRRSLFGQIEKLLLFSYGINYRALKKRIGSFEKDIFNYCYVRYSPATRGLISILKIIKSTQKDIKVILEIPTYPYENEFKKLKAKPSKIKDRVFRRFIKRYVDLIITPSHIEEDIIFGVPALEITNGIDIGTVKTRTKVNTNDAINLIGVALITPKQGYDRVIRGMSEYYKNKTQLEPDVYFYVIGSGNAKRELESLSNGLGVNDYVIFTGVKEEAELEHYYSIGDLGIGTLGLYKTNELLKVNSLKTREYCAKGLPFLITDCDYIFADDPKDFFMIVKDSEASIDIRSILRYLNELYNKYSYQELAGIMTEFAENNLSWREILKKVISAVEKE